MEGSNEASIVGHNVRKCKEEVLYANQASPSVIHVNQKAMYAMCLLFTWNFEIKCKAEVLYVNEARGRRQEKVGASGRCGPRGFPAPPPLII